MEVGAGQLGLVFCRTRIFRQAWPTPYRSDWAGRYLSAGPPVLSRWSEPRACDAASYDDQAKIHPRVKTASSTASGIVSISLGFRDHAAVAGRYCADSLSIQNQTGL